MARPSGVKWRLSGGVSMNGDFAVSIQSKTTYGEASLRAPGELQTFSFLIGKWDGKGTTKLPDGTIAEFR